MYEPKIILYSTGCPMCSVLKKKLDAKNVDYIENNSVEDMNRKGIEQVPVLESNGEILDFKKAIAWVNSL